MVVVAVVAVVVVVVVRLLLVIRVVAIVGSSSHGHQETGKKKEWAVGSGKTGAPGKGHVRAGGLSAGLGRSPSTAITFAKIVKAGVACVVVVMEKNRLTSRTDARTTPCTSSSPAQAQRRLNTVAALFQGRILQDRTMFQRFVISLQCFVMMTNVISPKGTKTAKACLLRAQ